jgi:hypothetical protein
MFRRFWPLLLASAITVLITLAGFLWAIKRTGAFCYALDDSFIMMALAKNLAFHGVWGLTPHAFSSTASSPLFAVLLAGFNLVLGPAIWVPLLINLLSLAGLYGFVYYLCRRWGFLPWQCFLALIGVFLFMPIPVLLFGSMEHILHTVIALFCLVLVLEFESNAPHWLFLLSGLLLTSIRYEGLFEGGLLVLWLWRQKKLLKGMVFGMGMMIPVCILGFYSLAQGWLFFPNSLVLKAYGMNILETGSISGFLHSWLSKAAMYPHCMVAIFTLLLLRNTPGIKRNQNRDWVEIMLMASIAHFMFSRYGHVFRYEAYLMGLSWIVVCKVLVQSGILNAASIRQRIAEKDIMLILLVSFLLITPLARSVKSYFDGRMAIVNIYEQQVQTALFVRKYYDDAVVAAIDVGAIAYYSNCLLQDLWGLGTMDFARLKLQNRYRPAEIDSVCRKLSVEIAIGYGNPIRQPGWKMTESWVIQDNRVCSKDTVDFYALHPDSYRKLHSHLRQFRSSLPDKVLVIKHPDL